jgi:AP2 domain
MRSVRHFPINHPPISDALFSDIRYNLALLGSCSAPHQPRLSSVCRVLYKLEGPDCSRIQIGLSAEEMRALDAVTLEQLLALLKRAHLQHRQTKAKYVGVFNRGTGRWQARWRSQDAPRSADFDTEDQAARAYDRWALQDLGR